MTCQAEIMQVMPGVAIAGAILGFLACFLLVGLGYWPAHAREADALKVENAALREELTKLVSAQR